MAKIKNVLLVHPLLLLMISALNAEPTSSPCEPLVSSADMEITCTLLDKVSDCQDARNGTVAEIKCKEPFHEDRNPTRVCVDGHWNLPNKPSCVPVCGKKSPKTEDSMGNVVPLNNPWHVAIYRQKRHRSKRSKKEPTKLICEGSLISERMILTAADCFFKDDHFSSNRIWIPKENLTVVVGKRYASFDDERDTAAQFSSISRVFIPSDYYNNRSADIAVILVEEKFNLTETVQPICINLDLKRDVKSESSVIRGWTYERRNRNATTAEFVVENVDLETCHQQLNQNPLPNQECAKIPKDNKVCKGLRGGALVSKIPQDDRYYITGVIGKRYCDNDQHHLIHTNVKNFTDFILDKRQSSDKLPSITGCGVKYVKPIPLILGGHTVGNIGEHPWQVAVYKGPENHFRCGGSIIDRDVIITSASCVTNVDGTIKNGTFTVAAGKYYNVFNDPRDEEHQVSVVKKIFVPKIYAGDAQNYQGDIAFLRLTSPFDFTKFVRPACVDLENNYDEEFLKESSTGFVSGWGLTNNENGNVSSELRDLEVPFVGVEQCSTVLPRGFRKYLTHDKFCAGYIDKNRSICLGDGGGPLVFKNEEDGKYYVTGVASIALAVSDACASNMPAIYTRVSGYIRYFFMSGERSSNIFKSL